MVIIGCGAFDRGFNILCSKVSAFLIDANPVNPILFDLYIYLTNFRIRICFNPAQKVASHVHSPHEYQMKYQEIARIQEYEFLSDFQ